MSDTFTLTIAHEDVELLADRALFWLREKTLFVADLHLGKANTFQQLGVPLQDDTERELARLDRLVEMKRAQRLIVLGDLIHSRQGVTPELNQLVERWMADRTDLEIIWVTGNHDRHSENMTFANAMDLVSDTHEIGPFFCAHEPTIMDNAHVLCGHLHPSFVLHDRNSTRMRCACFWVRPHLTVLPAFGELTGTEPIDPERGDQIVLLGEGRLRSLSF